MMGWNFIEDEVILLVFQNLPIEDGIKRIYLHVLFPVLEIRLLKAAGAFFS